MRLLILILAVFVRSTLCSQCSCSCSSVNEQCASGTNANPNPQSPGSGQTNTSGPAYPPSCPDQTDLLRRINSLQLNVQGLRGDMSGIRSSIHNLQESLPETINHSLNITWTVAPGPDNDNTSFPGDIIFEGIHKTHPRDCREIRDAGDSRGDGLYRIYDPAEDRFINVRCGMYCDGGGWLEIMRRTSSGTENFNRTWAEYVSGFGDLRGEFWMGLEYVHKLAKQFKNMLIRLDLVTFEDDHKYVQYNKFSVGDAASEYMMDLGTYSGSAGTGLFFGDNKKFSTYDNDNDGYSSLNCALKHGGGWWFPLHASWGNVWPTGKVNDGLNKNLIGGIAYGTSYSSSGYILYKSVVIKVRPAFGLP